MNPRYVATAAILACLTCVVDPFPTFANEELSYLRDVKPLLVKHCYKCHSSIAMEGDVRLDSHLAMTQNDKAVVYPKDVESSPLLRVIRNLDGIKMPPSGPGLDDQQIAVLESWIRQGAIGPPNGDESKVDHWAFQPPELTWPDNLTESAKSANIVDCFVDTALAAQQIRPATRVSKETLLRRLYLDLLGVPPTDQELANFLNDDREEAYEQVVEQLLSNPMYAERWARHWMDIWRYSDWDGFGEEIRESQPHVWRWRDWIVESLEKDKPYSEMLTEMLAADELPNATDDSIRATGFLVRQWYKFNRNTWIDNTVEHSSKAFMGLTMNCARCHDHMYNPISQKEYYQFRAFFEPIEIRIDRLPGQSDTKLAGLARVYDKQLDAKTYVFARGNEKNPILEDALQPAVPKVLGVELPSVSTILLDPDDFDLGRRQFIQDEMRSQFRSELEAAQKSYDDQRAQENPDLAQVQIALAELSAAASALSAFEAKLLADDLRYRLQPFDSSHPEYVRFASQASTLERQHSVDVLQVALEKAELALNHAQTELQALPDGSEEKTVQEKTAKVTKANEELNDIRKRVAEAAKGLANSSTTYQPIAQVYPRESSGRRLALARWLTDRKHPLTARVAVNHVWARHFGQPLVDSVFDFGLNGRAPSNQRLLDALAVEFMDSGWSLKHLHRRIVTSATYQRSKHAGEAHAKNLAIDPNNRSFWKFPSRRMEAEVIRDSTLFIAGRLDLSRGGADLDPQSADSTYRRSLYYRCSKEKRPVYLALFDGPSVVECYRRNESIVPQQALALMNSQMNHEQARQTATLIREQIHESALPSEEITIPFVTKSFWKVLGRAPSQEEITGSQEFLDLQTKRFAEAAASEPTGESAQASSTARQAAEVSLIHVLFNHHEFVTIP